MLCLRRPSQSQAEEDDEEDRVSVKSVVSFSSPVKVKVPTQLANFSNFSRVLSFSVPQFSDRSGLAITLVFLSCFVVQESPEPGESPP